MRRSDPPLQVRPAAHRRSYVSRKGVEVILAELAVSDPKARQAKVEDFLDMRFIAAMERDGFFKKLAAK